MCRNVISGHSSPWSSDLNWVNPWITDDIGLTLFGTRFGSVCEVVTYMGLFFAAGLTTMTPIEFDFERSFCP